VNKLNNHIQRYQMRNAGVLAALKGKRNRRKLRPLVRTIAGCKEASGWERIPKSRGSGLLLQFLKG
jgi:hypothetical protein